MGAEGSSKETWRGLLEAEKGSGEIEEILGSVTDRKAALSRETARHGGESELLVAMGNFFDAKLYCEGLDSAESYLRLDDGWEYAPGSWLHRSPESDRFMQSGGKFNPGDKLRFFRDVIEPVAENCLPMRFVELANEACRALAPADRVAYFTSIRKHVLADRTAFCLLECLIAQAILWRAVAARETSGQASGMATTWVRVVQGRLDALGEKVQGEGAVGPVLAAYYGALSLLGRAKGDFGMEYKNGVISLFYSELNKVPLKDRVEMIAEVCLSGLLAPLVFDFGELLSHPCVAHYLKKSAKWEFLWQIMVLLQKGDTKGTRAIIADNKLGEIDHRAQTAQKTINEKIRIIGTLSFLFECKQTDQKCISFRDIEKRCDLTALETEPLLLRILSLNLLEAKIDGLTQTLTIVSERPRSLDKQQLEILAKRFEKWTTNTRTLLDSITLPPRALAL